MRLPIAKFEIEIMLTVAQLRAWVRRGRRCWRKCVGEKSLPANEHTDQNGSNPHQRPLPAALLRSVVMH